MRYRYVTLAALQVDELRRRAETSAPSAAETKGLQLWLASGGKGRERLTDVDLLRFIMFRWTEVDLETDRNRVYDFEGCRGGESEARSTRE